MLPNYALANSCTNLKKLFLYKSKIPWENEETKTAMLHDCKKEF